MAVKYSKTTLDKYKKEAMPVLVRMAQQMVSIEQSDISPLVVKTYHLERRSIWYVNVRLNELENYGFIQKDIVLHVHWMLTPEIHLSIIERYKDPKVWKAERIEKDESLFGVDLLPSFPDWLLQQMVAYLQGESYLEPEKVSEELRQSSAILNTHSNLVALLEYAMKQEQWVCFMQAFSRLFPDLLHFNLRYVPILSLKSPDEFCSQRYFVADPLFLANKETRRFYLAESFLAFMCGDMALSKNLAEKVGGASFCDAIRAAYDGDSRTAVEIFNQYLTIDKDHSVQHIETFSIFVYAICLKNVAEMDLGDMSKEAIRRIKLLQKDLKKCDKPWMELIAAKVLDTPIEKEKALPKLVGGFLMPLEALLTDIVLRYYYGYEEPLSDYMKIAETSVDVSCYRLLRMELLHSMPAHKSEYEILSTSIGVKSPLINGAVFVPKWERFLDELVLQTSVEDKTTKQAVKAESQARVIYNVWINEDCTEFYFTPRLQKSKDGISWTGGRNIALKNFGKTSEGMTEIDIQISRHVKAYTQGWYGQTSYELRGKEVLELLCGHPHVYLERGGDPSIPVQIAKENLQITVDRSKGGFVIKSNVEMSPSVPYVNVVRENTYSLKIIKLTSQQRDLIKALSEHRTFPKEAESKLTKVLGNISRHTTVMSDMLRNADNLDTKMVQTESLLTIRLRPIGEGIQADVQVRPLGINGPGFIPGRGSEVISAIVEGKPLQTKRNLKLEKEHLSAVQPLLYQYSDESDGETSYSCFSPLSILSLLDALYPLNEHCRLEWPEGEKMRIARRLEAKDMQLTVKGAKGWFEVDGEIKVNEKKVLHMAELLERLRDGKGRFIQIGDTEYIAISDQLRKQLAQLESMASVQRKKVQLSLYSTSALECLEEAGVSIDADKSYLKFMERIHKADEVKFSLPKGLQAELRDYQLDGVKWMNRLASWGAGACLADDMGLGKTLQAITLMLSRKSEGASLVVVPTSVVLNWENEIERFAPQLNVLLLNTIGTDREKMINDAGNCDVVIATYGLLVTEEELLTGKEWNMIVLDEAHTIKNKETKMSQSAMQLQGAFRLLLTGTPLQNHLGELWNLFQFSNPGLLGSNKQFLEKFIMPIEKLEDNERMRQLKRIVSPFILRRTKNEVLDELPEKSEVTVEVQLSDEEMAVYENLRRDAILSLESGESTPMQTLAEITKLRQAACNVRLINDKLKISSSKLTMLMDMVGNLISNGHRALVFSQFTSHLALVREALDAAHIEYLYLDGACTARERERLVKEFQTGTMPLFLISLKAGGTGLNLTAADYVFHLDPWWNPAIEDQASDRTYRIGQTRPVTIYRLIAQQTIEEKILHLHSTKKSLADSLLTGTNASHKLTKDEILQLLK